MRIPKIATISRVRFNSRNIRWGTNVAFENGTVLRFTGKLSRIEATNEANRYYRALLATGSTEEEIAAYCNLQKEQA